MKTNAIFLLIVIFLFALPTFASEQGTLLLDDLERTYTLYVPDSYDGSEPVPLIIALHAIAGSGKTMEAMTDFNAYADEHGFIVAYPDSFRLSWYLGLSNSLVFQDDQVPNDLDYIPALIEHLAEEYAIDTERVHLTGFDSGGLLVYRLACQAPELFASVSVVSTLMWDFHTENCEEHTESLDLLVIHGSGNVYYPVEGRSAFQQREDGTPFHILSSDEFVTFWSERLGCDLPPGTHPDE